MSDFKPHIEKGVPFPRSRDHTAKGYTQALRTLANGQIGDSMFFPLKPKHLRSLAFNAKIGPGCFRTFPEGEGTRVWKIGEPINVVDTRS